MARQIGGSADPRHGQGPPCRPELTRIFLLFPSTTRNTTTRGPLGRRLALGLALRCCFGRRQRGRVVMSCSSKAVLLWLGPGVAAGFQFGGDACQVQSIAFTAL